MLSANEREYIKNPEKFEKQNSSGYVRKLQSSIRWKCMIAAEDIIRLAKFHKKYDYIPEPQSDGTKKKSVGRYKKCVVPLGFFEVCSDVKGYVSWIEGSKKEKNCEESMEKNRVLLIYYVTEGTKTHKLLFPKLEKQKKRKERGINEIHNQL